MTHYQITFVHHFPVVGMFWNKQRNSLALYLIHVDRNVLSVLYSLPHMFFLKCFCDFLYNDLA